ncbi:hypothetical protein AB0H71_31490 [Nocardia sp. NPDC050697]|uniref:hypothetical protein n=1 Tax=Nocardia sp. NPDC050697 TaxID=3155158 RepID=UPI0033D643F9
MSTETAARAPLWFRHPVLAITLRWAPIVGGGAIAFDASLDRLQPSAENGQRIGYLVMLPLLALVAALGIARRRYRELPIHDRQVDYIVGGMALVLAVVIVGLLVPRYPDTFDLLRLDMYAGVAYYFGGCVLMFGLRATGRFWPVWLVVLLFGPLPYRALAVLLGGDWKASALVSVLFVGFCAGIAVARTWRRGLLGAVVGLLVGLVLVGLLDLATTGIPNPFVQQLPAALAAAAVGIYFIWHTIRNREPNAHLVPRREPTVARPWPALIVLAAATVALALLPLPPPIDQRIGTGPPLTDFPGLSVPDGWDQTGFARLDWAPQFFGTDATLVRQVVTADRVVDAWDTKGRRRTLVVDTLNTDDVFNLQVYPGQTLYSTIYARRSDPLTIELAPGLTGRIYTIVDENLFLTWTYLSFIWHRGAVVESVRVIAVDNHEPDAPFPEPTPNMGSIAAQTFTIMMRGNAVAVDDKPEYKDVDLLTTFGRALVAEQWEAP